MTEIAQMDPRALVLFTRYSVSELATRTPYSEAYLLAIKNGHAQIREVFRLRVAKALGVPEDELFSLAGDKS